MIAVDKPQWTVGADGARISFLVSSDAVARGICEQFQPGKRYDMEIKQHREKRSRNANDLLWTLCTQISEKLSKSGLFVTKEDIYRQHIREAGVCDFITINNRAIDRFEKDWSEKGIGWFADKVDAASDYETTMCVYYGSSTYDTSEMSRLLETVVQDAKSIGIDVMNESDRALLAQYPWGQGYG